MAERLGPVRDIGELGQDHFKTWCTDNGLSAVPAKPDRFGWDFFVEFEPEIDVKIPLDRQGGLTKVLVQVKSSESSSSRSVSAKLSALKRLVDTPLPAFMASLQYRVGHRQPVRARLLHIGLTQIEKILRKVRQTEKDGRTDINNVRISLSLDESVEIDLDGGNLRDVIRAACRESADAYAVTKATLRRSCGYDQSSIRANFSLSESLSEAAMVDLMLGYVPDLSVSDMTISRSRFGITIDKDIDRIGAGILSIDVKPIRHGKVKIVNKNQNRRPILDIDVFAPGIPGLSKDAMRVRLKNEFLDVSLHLGRGVGNITFWINPEVRIPIERLADALAFGIAMSEPEADLVYEIESFGESSIRLDSSFKSIGSFRLLHEFVETLTVALFRCRRGAVVEVSLREISEALDSNKDMFLALSRSGVKLTCCIPENYPDFVPLECAIYMPVCISFAGLAYEAIVRANARAVLEDNRTIRLIGEKPTVIDDAIVDQSKLNIAELNDRAAKLGKAASGHGRFIATTIIDCVDRDEMR